MSDPLLTTEMLAPDKDGLARAASLLQAGATVAFPTETVYGLGADARNSDAVAGIYAAKSRPSFNPLIVHVPDIAAAKELVDWSESAQHLAAAFWPGALTLVLPLRHNAGISPLVTAGLDTLAVRCPAGAVAQALLKEAGVPVAAPSANPSGRISSTTADHVKAGLDGRIAAILDGGPCTVGVESTILGLQNSPVLLRPGGVAREEIEAVLGHPVALRSQNDAISAPGQLASHYAPEARVRLDARAAEGNEVLIGFGDVTGDMTLSATGDLREAATNLFPMLHAADATGRPIAIAPIPDRGLGVAINDRLRRAATPR